MFTAWKHGMPGPGAFLRPGILNMFKKKQMTFCTGTWDSTCVDELYIPARPRIEEEKSPFKSSYAFRAKLAKKGFKHIGGGFYSAVYAHPTSDRVIKVNHGHKCDAWIDYVLWANQQGYGGKFAPKMYSYKHYGNFYVAIMERMEYTVADSEMTSEAPVAQTLFSLAATHENEKAKLLVDLLVPGLGEFSEKLRKTFPSERLDLHEHNIMYRKDGSICVTDPLCHESTLTVTRLRARDFLAPSPTLH